MSVVRSPVRTRSATAAATTTGESETPTTMSINATGLVPLAPRVTEFAPPATISATVSAPATSIMSVTESVPFAPRVTEFAPPATISAIVAATATKTISAVSAPVVSYTELARTTAATARSASDNLNLMQMRASRPASVITGRSTRSAIEAERKRIEYEAELAEYEASRRIRQQESEERRRDLEAKRRLLQMEKEMKLAALNAEEEEEMGDDRMCFDDPALGVSRVVSWMNDEAPDRRPIFHEEPSRRPDFKGAKMEEPSSEQKVTGLTIEELASRLQHSRPTPKAFYELPIFSGDPGEWPMFKRRYMESTATFNFQPSENLVRLQMAITGKAKQLVEDSLRNAEDPDEIMQSLDRVYGSERTLLNYTIARIKRLPKISSDDHDGLRIFSASVRSCLSALRSIGAEDELNSLGLMKEVLEKLSPQLKEEYRFYSMQTAEKTGTKLSVTPKLMSLVEFLEKTADSTVVLLADTLSSSLTMKPQKKPSAPEAAMRAPHRVLEVSEAPSRRRCVKCDKEHHVAMCPDYLKLDVEERWNFVKANHLCFKCLKPSHSRLNCRGKKCSKCNFGHHSTLHHVRRSEGARPVEPTASASSGTSATVETTSPARQSTETVSNVGERTSKALLKVIPVRVKYENSEVDTYALLDDGATVSLIDDSLIPATECEKKPLHIISASGHEIVDKNSRRVLVVMCGPNGEARNVHLRTVSNLVLPPQSVSASMLERCSHLKDLNCGVLEEATPKVLIGQDNLDLLISAEMRRGKSGMPVASLTALGWVIHGPVSNKFCRQTAESVNQVQTVELEKLIRDQFELDAIGIVEKSRVQPEDERATAILASSTRLTDRGWEVGLLWKHDHPDMPDNYDGAMSRLKGVERKLDRDPEYAKSYYAQIDRLIENRYAEKIEVPYTGSPIWYLPHFGVTNVNKPGKLRLVYDAAATFKGTSLNDKLLSGPDLLNSLLGILFKFRSKPVAITADIADMFLRVKVSPKDRGAQLFLWRGMDRTRQPDVYVMSSMIFGAASSPTSAIYVLNKNADRFKSIFPEAVKAVHTRHYMDDYLDSVDDVDTAAKMISEVSEIHTQGNFHIRGWNTDSEELRAQLPNLVPDSVDLTKLGGEIDRTLGLLWSPRTDVFSFNLAFKKLKPQIIAGEEVPTKREFLSCIMSLFDPLGLACPITIDSRIIMQKVWQSGIEWDEKLDEPCFLLWKKWVSSLEVLRSFTIPRFYNLCGPVTLHVFGDASEQAYAAVAYFVDDFGQVSLIAGNARVAPLKVVSMPRLELHAAVLACRLANIIEKEHELEIKCKVLWTDSKTVMCWINGDPKAYKPFVSHRLAEIDRRTKKDEWRWTPGDLNPADEATRLGWTIEKSKWLHGPPFLKRPPEEWPGKDPVIEIADSEQELRSSHLIASISQPNLLIDVTRFSTWIRAVRVVARVLACVRCWREKKPIVVLASHVKEAERLLLQQSQQASFATELQVIKSGGTLSEKNRLGALDPMLTDDGLLRVRGRLIAAEIPFEAKHPIILDGRDYITQLLISNYHVKAIHGNNETVVNLLREKYWIFRLRSTVKKVAASCQFCKLRRAQPSPPKMGDLPPARLAQGKRAFSRCGIDYFGPLEVTIGRRREKRWGIVFTCLTIRAIHLEIAASLSADSALMALRRFFARRGQPEIMYSDRGTNFVGAFSELKSIMEVITNSLQEEATNKGIEWRFISPSSPHMGGCWERLVRSTKNALKVTMKARAPREEVLQTLFAEIEMVINSRLLTHVPVDPRDPIALTPNHLLLGSASGVSPWGKFEEKDYCTTKLWKKTQVLADIFWKRWIKEYMPTLNSRPKWRVGTPSIQEGDIVIIGDHTLPRGVWPKGRVVKTYPGKDGHVRIVDVKTNHGILKRPVVKLAILPTSD